MSPIFDKLNLKQQSEILVLNAPASFEPAMAALHDTRVLRQLEQAQVVNFALAFVTTQAEVDALVPPLVDKARGDALLWFAYPKGSSKKFASEVNRDRGWAALGEAGFQTVRQIAIDEDWSALRFRRVEYMGAGRGAGRKATAGAPGASA